jgi:transposase
VAYHEVAMWEVLDVLERLRRRETKTAIARATGCSRSTVRRYAGLAEELGWKAGALVEPVGGLEAVAVEITKRLRPVGRHELSEARRLLMAHESEIRDWLRPPEGQKRGLRLSKVHQLLGRQGIVVPYSTLHRFAVTQCGFGAAGRVTVRMAEARPGELAEIDFGRLGLVYDPEAHRQRTAWALVVVLVHSRHQYVHVSYSQTLQSVILGLEDAWIFFGGVVLRVGLDNLAAAITKADRYDPIFQRTMAEYARHRSFVIDPAPVRMPTGKPFVERSVPYVRENFFRGETWRDLAHVREEAIKWCTATAGQRIHGTTRQRPLVVFENVERPALQPLVRGRFDPPAWAKCKVHPDHHLSFGKALYSVPTRFVGQSLWVRADSSLVRIYAEHGIIKTHPLAPPGGRATDHNDYPSELTPYTLRDPARIVREAQSRGTSIGRFAGELLAGTFPWSRLRQAQRLLRLGNKYGWHRLDGACQRALAFELTNVKRVESILRHGIADTNLPVTETRVYECAPRFARKPESFAHHRITQNATPSTTSDDGATNV